MYKLLSDVQRELRQRGIYTQKAAQALDYLERLFDYSQTLSGQDKRRGTPTGEDKPEGEAGDSGADGQR